MAIEVLFDKRIGNALIVHEVDKRQHRQYVLVTLLAALFVAGLLFYGWQHYRWLQYGYELEAAQRKREELRESNSHFVLERDSLATLERIEALARGIGMKSAAPGQLLTFSSGTPFTTPAGASPALTAKK